MKYGLSFDVLGVMEKGFGKKLSYKGKHFCLCRIFANLLHFLEPFLKKLDKMWRFQLHHWKAHILKHLFAQYLAY